MDKIDGQTEQNVQSCFFLEKHMTVTVLQTLWFVKILGSNCKQNNGDYIPSQTVCVPKVKIISCCLANLTL